MAVLKSNSEMDPSLKRILEESGTIAIVGCSADPYRTSYHIAKYLQDSGYRIIPVNPKYKEVLGETCYPALMDIPSGSRVDVVNIFRNSRYTAGVIEDIIYWAGTTGHKPVIWTQLGVSSDEAKDIAVAAGFVYVEEACMMVEHQRLFG